LMSSATENDVAESIAIIGMAGRFPGANNLDEFWRNLCEGKESISVFSRQELEEGGVETALLDSPEYVRARGILTDVEMFDAAFFGFSGREAQLMEPQHRLFLESSWAALEQAGYDSEKYDGLIGVYGGMSMGEYLYRNLAPHRDVVESVGPLQLRILNDKDFLTPLVAYKLNLRGPSVNVQTACSTSLVAVSLACQALLTYQCDMALAGGVSVTVPQKAGYIAREGVFAPDGHCRAFDANAQGTVSGNGVGVAVLKRLSDALADGDSIQAVIKGTAINNDGALKVGYSAPSVAGQAEVIAMAQAIAGVDPETISYIEAHGTGTPLGDAVEIAALTQAFRVHTNKKTFCAIGSVKTNMGHADAAAGISSLLKTTLALKHKTLPPSINFKQNHPEIGFENTPFYVNESLREWKSETEPRRAGVSSFAMGGVNSHVVMEEAPACESGSESRKWQLLLLSAKTDTALETATDNLSEHLGQHPELNLADVAYTLQTGRRDFKHRRMLVCSEAGQACQALSSRDPKRVYDGTLATEQRPIAFMFPGLGNHYVNMGWELYQNEQVFRESIEHCCEHLKPILGLDLRDVIHPEWRNTDRESDKSDASSAGLDLRRMLRREVTDQDAASQKLNQTRYAQPALFVIEYALARLWMAYGIRPQALLGYSIGEYVAACLAGVFSLEDALLVVAERAKLIEENVAAGRMLAAPLSEKELIPLLGDRLSIAAINGPELCVVAGPHDAVANLEKQLAEKGLACRELQTSHAFHSWMLDRIEEPFARLITRVKLNPPTIPLISDSTGTWLTAAEATDPQYWARHMSKTVRFADGVEELWKSPDRVLLEVGPGQALGAWALQHPASDSVTNRVVVSSLRHSYDRQSDIAYLLQMLGRLWLAGAVIDWQRFYATERRRRVPLPTYPFERRRYWVEPLAQTAPVRSIEAELIKRPDIADWLYLPLWKQTQTPEVDEWPATDKRHWLIFTGDESLSTRLVERLQAEGQTVSVVKPGARFESIGNAYTIDPTSEKDYESMLEDLNVDQETPLSIIHLWSCDDANTFDESQNRGLYSLMLLGRAIGNRRNHNPVKILVVTNGVHSVNGSERLFPEKATVLGPGKVIPQEYPHVTCFNIDVDVPAPGSPDEFRLAGLLVAEATSQSTEPVVAYRRQRRWTQNFEPFRIEPATTERSLLREGGTYLLAGGLGGIGLVLAEHLVRTVHARLIITRRTPLPPRDEWQAWLTSHDQNDVVSDQLRKLIALEEIGADYLVMAADVTDLAEMQKVVAVGRERFGEINGVIHMAGVQPGGMISLRKMEDVAKVLAPKVQGTLVLNEIFKDAQLDFFLLFSSLNSIYGHLGLVDHCAANSFLDAFAQQSAAAGKTRVMSVNWDAWLEVGQAANAVFSRGLQKILRPQESGTSLHPLIDECVTDEGGAAIYTTRFSTARHWVVNDHRLKGQGLVPGVAYLEMVRAAFAHQTPGRAVELQQVVFSAPLLIADGEEKEVRTVLQRNGDDYEFHVSSGPLGNGSNGNGWQEHARGRVSGLPAETVVHHELQEIRERCRDREVDVTAAREQGNGMKPGIADERAKVLYFGPHWENLLQHLDVGQNEGLAFIELPELVSDDLSQFTIHPSLLDVATGFAQLAGEGIFLPLGYKRLVVREPLPRRIYSHVTYRENNPATIVCDFRIMDENGKVLIEIEDFVLRRATSTALDATNGNVSHSAGNGGAAPKVAEISGGVAATNGQEDHKQDTAKALVGIAPNEGGEVLSRIVSGDFCVPQIAVSTRDLPALIRQVGAQNRSRLIVDLEKLQSHQKKQQRPNLATSYAAPRNETERNLAEIWQEILGIEQVGVFDNFFDLGGDSLLASQLITRLEKAFDVDMSLRNLFAAPTVADLSVVVLQKQAEQVNTAVLAELLAEIKEFSPAEVQTMLSAETMVHDSRISQ
jgi:acyl transferase domain-containing protein/acyl carrier protein